VRLENKTAMDFSYYWLVAFAMNTLLGAVRQQGEHPQASIHVQTVLP
jgi:hypothetical protein